MPDKKLCSLPRWFHNEAQIRAVLASAPDAVKAAKSAGIPRDTFSSDLSRLRSVLAGTLPHDLEPADLAVAQKITTIFPRRKPGRFGTRNGPLSNDLRALVLNA